MTKTIALRNIVKGILDGAVTPTTGENPVPSMKVYYGQAEKDAATKYIVYTIAEVMREDERTTLELEVNVMDYGTDTSAAETLADTIQAAFDKQFCINSDIACYFYIEQRNTLTEQDRLIIRRRLTFTTYLYERK